MIKNVLICGLGAIGSIYAVKLSQNPNINLKVLVDADRLNRYRQEPLIFNNESYVFDYILPEEIIFKADFVLLATKSDGFANAIQSIGNFISSTTIFMSLLNGLESEDLLIQKFGKDNVLYSYYIGHTSTRIGRKVVHDDYYKTVFGLPPNSLATKNLLLVQKLFENSNINYEIPEDIEYSRWWKFLVNVGYNQASSVFHANYGVFQTNENVNNFAIKLMQEALLCAKAIGVKNTEKMIPEVLDVIENMLPETRTSMLQDIDAKRTTEVAMFAGYVCKIGELYNIPTPYNKVVLDIIMAIDSMIPADK